MVARLHPLHTHTKHKQELLDPSLVECKHRTNSKTRERAMATPSNLQVTPAAAFTEYKELNFQGLYLHHMFWNRPKANQARIIENKAPLGIGATVVNN